jgi:homoserine/homoserine lactone efflux protein
MDPTVWALFVLTDLAIMVIPGPAVLFVISQGLRRGPGSAFWAPAGILTANAIYFAISGTGIGALFATSAVLFTYVKWAGAAYLLYLGVAAFRDTGKPVAASPTREQIGANRRTMFFRGLMMQLSNPKSLLFFMAVVPQFINRNYAVIPQLLILGGSSIMLEFLVLATYGTAAARIALRPRFATITSRVSGMLLITAGLGLSQVD